MPATIPRVVLHYDGDGNASVISEVQCITLVIDECAIGDRVYQMQTQPYGKDAVDKLIGNSPIGGETR